MSAGIGPILPDYEREAVIVFQGSREAGKSPVEQPTKFEFIINLNAAKQIGLAIPPAILVNADKVIN